MADNIQIKDALGVTKTVRSRDLGSDLHVPIHGLQTLSLTGPAAQSVVNTDLLTGTVNGWYEVSDFASACVQIVASAGISAGAIFFEQTNDATSTVGIPLEADEAGVITVNPVIAAQNIAASSRRMFYVPLTCRYFRVRISTAFTGGTVQALAMLSTLPYASPVMNVQQVTATALNVAAVAQDNIFYNESTTAQAAAATVTGTARDTGVAAAAAHRYSAFNAFAFADQAGTIRIECSNDNTTWRRMTTDTAVAANTPVILSVPVMTRYHRAVYVNGATLQTAFMLNTSYTAA